MFAQTKCKLLGCCDPLSDFACIHNEYCTNMLIFHFVRGGIRYFCRKDTAHGKKHAPQTTSLFSSMQILFFCCDWAPRMICTPASREHHFHSKYFARSLSSKIAGAKQALSQYLLTSTSEADECHNASLAKCISAASKPNCVRTHEPTDGWSHLPSFLFTHS